MKAPFKRDLLLLEDLGGAAGLRRLLDVSIGFERAPGPVASRPLAGRVIALIFDKASTRTRVAFEVAAVELGAHPIMITQATSQTGRGEPVEDTARVLGRMGIAAVAYRTDAATRVEALARAFPGPVLNALTDDTHPLQVLADLHAVQVACGSLDNRRYAWIGDASNVARSWIEAAGLLGLELRLACPRGFEPPAAEVQLARSRGGRVDIGEDPKWAVEGAGVVVTDVWVSMGKEAEVAARKKALEPYRVSRALLAGASSDVRVLHCLPAHRGEEIDADVIDGPASLVWEAVAARLYTSKAALAWALDLKV
jgi:ornithine carbamoyltransferase